MAYNGVFESACKSRETLESSGAFQPAPHFIGLLVSRGDAPTKVEADEFIMSAHWVAHSLMLFESLFVEFSKFVLLLVFFKIRNFPLLSDIAGRCFLACPVSYRCFLACSGLCRPWCVGDPWFFRSPMDPRWLRCEGIETFLEVSQGPHNEGA